MTSEQVPPGPPFARWLVPSLGSVIGLVALANALLFRSGHFFAWDGDVGRHIRVGRTILDTGSIPNMDLFSHTRGGSEFIPYEWLSEALTSLIHGASGLAGVVVLAALLYTTAVIGVYRAADELGARRLLAFLVAGLALLLQSMHLLPRPHLFTTALAAIFMVILVRFARRERPWDLAALPLLMLVWVNSHGGFLAGFVLLVAFLVAAVLGSREFADARRAIRPLVAVLAACSVASLVNPAGVTLWAHTTGYLGIDFLVDATQEYRSVDFHAAYGKLFFVGLFAGPVLWMTGRVRVSLLGAGLYLFFGAAALHSARNIPLFTVASLPWLAAWCDEALQAAGPRGAGVLRRMDGMDRVDRVLRPGFGLIGATVLIGLSLGPNRTRYAFDPDVFPVRAVAALPAEVTFGPVFNQLIWGGYLLYERPDVPVFIDGQTDFYGEELSREYLIALKGGPGWRDVLDKYGVGWTLLGTGEPLNQLLELDPGWRMEYQDEVATMFWRVR